MKPASSPETVGKPSPRGAGRAAVFALGVALFAQAEGSSGSPVDLVAAVADGDGAATSVILVGSAGQLYWPVGQMRWARKTLGGIGPEIVAAVRTQGGELYALARQTPIFIYENGSWHARPLPNPGPVLLAASCNGPALAIDRHVYLHGELGWRRVASARQALSAAWVCGAHDLYLATTGGELLHRTGRAWRRVAHSLAREDLPVAFAGPCDRELFALAGNGTLHSMSIAGNAGLSLAPAVAEIQVQQLVGCVRDRLLLLAVVPDGDERRWVLAQAGQGQVERIEELPSPAPGDRYSIAYLDPEARLLVATAAGAVLLRGADGAWRSGMVSGEVPAQAIRHLHDAGPARAR